MEKRSYLIVDQLLLLGFIVTNGYQRKLFDSWMNKLKQNLKKKNETKGKYAN